ncbi:MAG: heat shock protein HspQ [Acidobacteriota bacterium]
MPEPLDHDPENRRCARFGVGELVYHKLFEYRGVVFDVDPVYQGTDEWYEEQARSRPPKDEPWYHVLVDGAAHSTYVAERNLMADVSEEAIDHPLVPRLFDALVNGHYQPSQGVN